MVTQSSVELQRRAVQHEQEMTYNVRNYDRFMIRLPCFHNVNERVHITHLVSSYRISSEVSAL